MLEFRFMAKALGGCVGGCAFPASSQSSLPLSKIQLRSCGSARRNLLALRRASTSTLFSVWTFPLLRVVKDESSLP